MKETGIVFDIQRFSVHDGPGIRTAVFLKGCPLRCVWCHNPEGYRAVSEILFRPDLCIGCGECAACPKGAHVIAGGTHVFYREKCIGNTQTGVCGLCASVCPARALQRAGREMSVREVMETVLRDRHYYQTGGGVTLSGGEPFYQADFALSLLRAAKENGINTAVETSGCAPGDAFCDALPYIDLLLFDCKLTDEEDHIRYTGVGRAGILENLHTASEAGVPVILRCPIIPSVNDHKDHIRGIAQTAKTVGSLREIQLEPYHSMGLSKCAQLGKEPLFKTTPPSREEIEELRAQLARLADKPVRISG